MSVSQFFASNMPLKFAPGFRACCAAGMLILSATYAAEQKPSLIGVSRDQIVARFGEPKSHIVAGNREILFFSGQRITLRQGVVTDVEELPVEAPPPSAARPTPAPDAGATTGPAGQASATASTAPANPAANPATQGPAESTETTTPPPIPAPAAPPEPEVVIKSVRPPSARTAVHPASVDAPKPASVATPATPIVTPQREPVRTVTGKVDIAPSSVPSKSVASGTVESAKPAPPSPAVPASPARPAPEPAVPPVAATSALEPASSSASITTSTETVATESTPAVPPPASAPATRRKRGSTEVADSDVDVASAFTLQTYLIAGAIIFGGAGYLWWRRRQRRLELAATAVSRSPFAPETVAAAGTGTRFTAELLSKLEWKRFEELVAAYYNKTGVVALRTKSGPASAVHIRISWKGESRPFACVQCIAHPAGLIEAAPVQKLCEALAAEDIRRGYVVSSGKFSVPARDVAEEKHITLLPGDVFLEKLNALPDPARNELMRDVTNGDYVTPSCPACEAKTARAAYDSNVWQCPQCGTVLPRT